MNYLKLITILLLFSSYTLSQTEKHGFKEIKIIKSLDNCSPDSSGCTYSKVDYLNMISGKNKEKINKFINDITARFAAGYSDSAYSSVENAAKSFVRDFAEFERSDSAYIPLPWTNEISVEQEKSYGQIICLTFSQFIFTGGAHTNSFFVSFNINPETGDTVQLKDIFIKGFEKKLDKLLDRKYRKVNGIAPDADLQNEGLFVSKIEHNNNFAVLKKGIRFFYNQYEIAPYAAGTTEIVITYKELSDIIKKDGLIDQ